MSEAHVEAKIILWLRFKLTLDIQTSQTSGGAPILPEWQMDNPFQKPGRSQGSKCTDLRAYFAGQKAIPKQVDYGNRLNTSMDTTNLLAASAVEIDRTGFEPIAFVRDVSARCFVGALAFLYCTDLSGRWDMKANEDDQTYDFMFEDEQDAFLFRVFI